ncbi:MAG: caspase family protein [Steroidobacteraceae bacterium]
MKFAWTGALLMCFAAVTMLAACSRESASPAAQAAVSNDSRSMPAGEERRIALVIGNSAYASSPLLNPANDAELIGATLGQVGFEVRLVKDGDQRGMKRAIQEFGADLEKAGPSAVGLFYYAGHGVQLSGRNYLIPVGAQIQRDADVEIEAVGADWVLEQMRYARNRLNFVILDACRNNPFARSFRSSDTGLAKMDAPAGVLIAYSTAPGDVAADGSGRNSPYSAALAQWMRDSDQPAELMFKRVRDVVRRETTERQTPWESSSLTGDNFYFARRGVAPSVGPMVSTQAASAPVVVAQTAQPAPSREPAAELLDDAASIVLSSQFNPETAPGTLCSRVASEWRVDSELTPGTVRLAADHTGTFNLPFKKPAKSLKWTCDVPNRRLVVRFDNGVEHTLTIDYIERYVFGYDFEGNAVTYNR